MDFEKMLRKELSEGVIEEPVEEEDDGRLIIVPEADQMRDEIRKNIMSEKNLELLRQWDELEEGWE